MKKIRFFSLCIALAVVCSVLLAGCTDGTTGGDETQKPTLPDITIENIYNYELSEEGDNIFDIAAKLPALPEGTEVTCKVTSGGGNVTVFENSKFFLVEKTRYDIEVTATLGDQTKTAEFTLTTEGYTGDSDSPGAGEIAVVSFPLADRYAGKTYYFGETKVAGLNDDFSIKTEKDSLLLEYTITSLSGDANFDDTAVVLIDGYEAGSDEAEAIATVGTDSRVQFHVYGTHTITIMSEEDSSANASLTVNYNNGYNTYTEQNLRDAFACTDTTATYAYPINLQTDIALAEGGNPFESVFLSTKAEVLYGNGHTIDGSKLARAVYTKKTNDADRNLAVLNFILSNHDAVSKVGIYDLTVLGNGEYNDSGYVEGTYNPKDVLCGITIVPIVSGKTFDTDPNLDQYDYAKRKEDGIMMQISSKHDAYRHSFDNVTVENVTIMDTLMGLKMQNIRNVSVKHLTSKNSFMNNVECYQLENAVFENLSLGYSGGAALELKEDGSRLYRYDYTTNKDHAAQYIGSDGQPVYMLVPANAYDANTKIDDRGYITEGNVLLADGTAKNINLLTESDEPLYVLARPDNTYVTSQTITLRGTFECDNWTAGNEVYYMKPGSQEPDSSAYIITALKQYSPNSVKTIDGVEKINYAIALIQWGVKNYTQLNIGIENDSFGFYSMPVELQKVIPGATWAYAEASTLYVNKPEA